MPGHLEVVADLHAQIDGIDVDLEGSGSRLFLHVDRPADVYRQLRQVPGLGRPRATVAFVANRLDEAGLTVDVVSGDERLASVGAGQASRIGQLLLGSPRVSLGEARAVGRVLLTSLTAAWRRRRHRTTSTATTRRKR